MIFNMQQGGVVPSKYLDEQTITPGTENTVFDEGTYLRGDITILGDSDLKAENIKKGVEIFGITGDLPAIGLAEMGFTKFSVDEFSFSSRTNGKTSINHSLGEVPKMFMILAQSTPETDNDITAIIGYGVGYAATIISYGGLLRYKKGDSISAYNASCGFYETYVETSFGSSYYFGAGITYKLITFA